MILQNVDILPCHYTASQSRRLQLESSECSNRSIYATYQSDKLFKFYPTLHSLLIWQHTIFIHSEDCKVNHSSLDAELMIH